MEIVDKLINSVKTVLLLLLGLASIFPLTVIADPATRVEIPAVKLTVGGSAKVIDLSTKFTHTGSATLTYTAKSSDKTKVTVSLSSANLTITAVSLGTATVTVTATHGGTRKVEQTFDVTVVSAPVASGSIPAMRIASGGSVDLRPYFSDADNDPLTYTAESSDETKVTVRVSGNSLEVTAVSLGTATVTVTAIDPNSLRATQTFNVTVVSAPVAQGSIPAVKLTVGGSAATVDVSSKFSDADGNTLTYTAKSSDTTKVKVSVSSANVIITPVAQGTATVTVTATDPDNLRARQTIAVTVNAPIAVGSIPPVRLTVGGRAATVDVSTKFSDPNNDPLIYTASSDTAKVRVSVLRANVTITPVAQGAATVTVTATDPDNLTAEQTIAVTVNGPPTAVGAIPPVKLTLGGSAATVDVSTKFSDPDNDRLTYTAESSNTARVRVSVSSANVIITPVAQGTATVTVTATDPDNQTATQTIAVTVVSAPVAQGSIPPVKLTLGGSAATVNVSTRFSDADGDRLTYTAESSNTARVRVSVSSANVLITAVALGTATVTVTATDTNNLRATQTIAVTVVSAPVAQGSIPPVKLTLGGSAFIVDVSSKFSDADGDRLTYTAESSNTARVRVSVSGTNVTITPVAQGAATVTVTATDPDNLTATQTIAVNVNGPPVAQGSIPPVRVTVGGSAATVDVSTKFSDPDNDRLTYTAESSNTARVRVSVSSANVIITPVAQGTATVTVTATDTNNLRATQTIAVTVNPNQAPVAQGTPDPVTIAVRSSSTTVDVSSYFSDPDGNPLTYTAESSDETKATVRVSSANVTITPVAQGGVLIVVTARDTSNLTVTQTIAVTVSPGANRAPVAQGAIPPVTITERGNPRNVDVSSYFSDPDNNSLTYRAASSHPSQATVDVSGSVVTITPLAQGTPTITVTARDPSNLTATQKIVVTVSPGANRAPVSQGAIPGVTIAERGNPRNVDVSSYFSDPDNNSLTYRVSSSHPSKATVDVSGSVVTITPLAQGSVLVLVTASDPSNLTATQVIAVTVSPGANRAPVAVGSIPGVTIAERGNPRNVDVSSYFSDPDNNSLTYRAFSSHPSQATVSVLGSVVTITPAAQGTPIVTVSASDGSLTATQTITVTVSSGANRAPVAQGSIPIVTLTAGNSPMVFDVFSRFSDPDNDTLAYTAESSDPSRATVNASASVLTITPIAQGTSIITVTARDPSNLTAIQQFSVVVNGDEDPNDETSDEEESPTVPVSVGAIAPVTLTAGGGATTVDVAGNFLNPNGNPLTYTAISNDTQIATVTASNSILTINPVAEGTTTLTVMAQNVAGFTISQTIIVTVNAAPNRAPTTVGAIAPVTMTAGDNPITIDVSIYFSDPDNDKLTYTVVSNDTRVVTITASSHILLMTPVAKGTTTILIMARDSEGLTIDQTVIVTVDAAPNNVPVTVGTIAPVRMTAGDSSIAVDVSIYFSDPDNDPLTYTVISNDTRVVTVAASNTTLIITPVAKGTTTLTVTVSDGRLTATQTIAVVVEAPPNRAPVAVETIPPVMFIVGDSAKTMRVSIYFTDPDNDTLIYAAVSTDPRVVTVAVSGTHLTLTPVAVGATTVTVTATDGSLTATHNIATMVVQSNSAPIAVGTIDPVKLTLKANATTLDVADAFFDAAADVLTYSAQSSDTGIVTVNVVNSTVIMTPIAEGVTNIIVTAQDSAGLTAFQTIDITVVPVPNRAPVPVGLINPITLVAGDSAKALDISGYFSDPDGDMLIYSAVSTHTRVATVSVSDITLTINPVTAGTATVMIIVQDAKGLTATRNLTVMVSPAPNRAPVVEQAIAPLTMTTGASPITLDVSTYFSDPDNDTLAYTTVSRNPDVVTAEMTHSTLSLRPVSAGTTTVMVLASDSQLNITQTVTVTVNTAPNRAPVTQGTIAPVTLTAGDSAVTVDVSIYFSDPDNDPLSYTAVSTNPDVATAEMTRSTLSIRPVAQGSITIMVVVEDAEGLTVTQHLTVTVNPAPNRAPVAVGDIDPIALTLRDSSMTVNLSTNFSDPDNDPLTYTAVSNDATKAQVSMSGTDLTITPVLEGIVEVMVIVQDAEGLTVTERITVTVYPAPNRAPVAVGDIDPITLTLRDNAVTVDVSLYFSDPDGDPLTYSAQSADDAVATVAIEGANLAIRPVGSGSTTITIAAQDAEAETLTRNFQVIVNTAPNAAPTFTSATVFTVEENNTIVGTVTATDSDSEDRFTQYTLIGGADSAMFSIYPLSGALRFNDPPDFETPGDTSQTNRYIVGVQVQTGSGNRVLTAEQTITVSVTDTNDAPLAVGTIDPVTLTVGDEDQTVDVSTKFSDPDGDTLTYTARSEDTMTVMVSVTDATITLTAVEAGRTQVTVTARDSANLAATQPIAVTVDVVVEPAAAGGFMRLDATLAAVLDNTALMQLNPDWAVANGDQLKLSVDVGLTGLEVTADISALDTTQSFIALTPNKNGVYTAEIRISADNTALNGVKHILVTATDAKGASTQLIVKTTLNNRYVTELLPNYPNPFNPETWIPYRLGKDAEVVMTIYDAQGSMVKRFELGYQAAGAYDTRSRAVYWNGTNDFGEPVSTGVYFYSLSTTDYSRTRKAIILK